MKHLLLRSLKPILSVPVLLGEAFAQQTPAPAEMADAMRADGKIYVVVAVILTILAGLLLYLLRIDRRIDRLEKDA